jgi:AcrR family transcriptional regulator
MPRNALTTAEVDSMRTRLCDAALGIFREHGVGAVTFRALAEDLGVSHTLPYRYFDNKDALLASVRVACFEQFERFVREREPAGESALSRALAVIDACVSFVFAHPVEYTLIFATSQPPPQRYPELLAARRSLFEHAVSLMQTCVEEGLVKGDARQIAHAVWGSLHGLLTLHVANQLVHGYTIQELVRPTVVRILGIDPDQLRRATSHSAPRRSKAAKR